MAAVTFDVWHTLLYLAPDEEEAYYRTQVELAVEALKSAAARPGAAVRSDLELAAAFEAELSEAVAESGRGRTVTPRDQILRAGVRVGREPAPEPYLERLAAAVERQPFKAAPGAVELLARLRTDGFRRGVVGNTVGETGASLRRVLDRLGLLGFIERSVFSDELPWAKPAPEIFWAVLRELGEARARTVHIGDAYSDIEGARRAGLRGSILYTGLQEYGPHYRSLNVRAIEPHGGSPLVASELGEVPALLAKLFANG